YDGTGEIKNLDAALRDAFDIPDIPGASEASAIIDIAETSEITTQKPKAPGGSREDILIERWINGEGLDQTVAQQLRNLIFPAIAEAIDWDMLGLARTSFVGSTGRAFQSNSIS